MTTPAASPILVVGSVALDSVETPFEAHDDLLGGAASHFSVSASLFAPIRLVGVVGRDFPDQQLEVLRGRDIDLAGLAVADGPSFRWRGRYHLDMDHRDTLDLSLGVFADFRPRLPAGWDETPFVFLANIDPDLQLHVLDQARGARLTACDTIEHWIMEKRARVDEVFSRVDLVFLNEEEARLYAGTQNLRRAAATILDRGCRAVLVKKGENGALVVRRLPDGGVETFVCGAYPLEDVVDPTGAGDSFAGGVMGYLAATGDGQAARLREAVATGTIMASFSVEEFGPAGMMDITEDAVAERYSTLQTFVEIPARA